MTKAEVMKCAAILAAGIISNESSRTTYDVERAVDLMLKISERIVQKTAEPEREYRQL